MSHTVCYPVIEGREQMGTQFTYGQTVDIQNSFAGTLTRQSRKGKKKGKTVMANEQNVNVEETEGADQEVNQESASTDNIKRIQKTVFDLATFKNVTLYNDVEQPKKPVDMVEAQQIVKGDTNRLLNLIHVGLLAETNEAASKNFPEGFKYCRADYPLDPNKRPALEEAYTGSYAEGEKKAMINAAVLNMAKMIASATNEEVAQKHKDQAMEIIRANPVMLKGIQG